MRISRSRFKQFKNCSVIDPMNLCFAEFSTFLGDFWDVWEEIVFLKGLVKFREIANVEDLLFKKLEFQVKN